MFTIKLKKKKNGLSIVHINKGDGILVRYAEGRIYYNKDSPFRNDINCELTNCGCRFDSLVWISHKLNAIWFVVGKSASRSILANLKSKEPDFYNYLYQFYYFDSNTTEYLTFETDSESHYENFLICLKRFNSFKFYFKKRSLQEFQSESLFHMYYGSPNQVVLEFPNYFSFGFLRNPIEKMISNYLMFTQKKGRRERLQQMMNKDISNLSFQEFTEFTLEHSNHHWDHQYKSFPEDISKVSYIGILDTIDQDWSNIARKLNLPNKLNKINQTDKLIDQGAFYTDDLLKKVNRHFDKDISLYNYYKNKKQF